MKPGTILAVVLFAAASVLSIPEAGAGGSATAPSPRGKMPGSVVLGSLVSEYGPVAFDHSAHVKEAGSCAECHHQHGTGETLECRKCHSVDPAAFRAAVRVERFRPCSECHSPSLSRTELSRPALQAAYHRACFRCHRDVGSVGEDPKGCTEMCHERREFADKGPR